MPILYNNLIFLNIVFSLEFILLYDPMLFQLVNKMIIHTEHGDFFYCSQSCGGIYHELNSYTALKIAQYFHAQSDLHNEFEKKK